MLSVEAVSNVNGELLQSILHVYKNSFPTSWHYSDADEFFREALVNYKNINVILKEEDTVVGYALLRPQMDVIDEIKEYDPEMQADDNQYYLETIEIVPEHRSHQGFLMMVSLLLVELGVRKISRGAMHARVSTGLSKLVPRFFGKMIVRKRRVENWAYYGGVEPCDYFEIMVPPVDIDVEALRGRDHDVFRILRSLRNSVR